MSIAVLHISSANFARSDHLGEDVAIGKSLAEVFDKVYIYTSFGLPRNLQDMLNGIAEIVLWDDQSTFRVRWLRYLPKYYAEAASGKAVFYKKPSCSAISSLRRYMSAYARLREITPSVLVTTFVGKDHSLIVAANSLGIPTIGVQHGPYYTRFRKMPRPYEWPATHIAVWNREILELCNRKFTGVAEFFSMGSPLWTAREPNVYKSDRRVLIYESQSSGSLIRIAKMLFNKLGTENVAFKAHPHLGAKGSSLARQFPGELISEDINGLVPLLGISFGSTVTDQLIRRGVPCVTLLDTDGFDENAFPQAGTFAITRSFESEIVSFVLRLYADPDERRKLWKTQAEERSRFGIFSNDGIERISEYCKCLIEDKSVNNISS